MPEKLSIKDNLFDTTEPVNDFKFDERVAGVFDNMVSRSVPFYNEMQRMICQLTADFAAENSNVYDLGCSTGTTFSMLHQFLNHNIGFIGIDNSSEMLEKAKEKLSDVVTHRPVELLYADLEGQYTIENASVAMMILTLQFVRPLSREKIARKIYDGLRKNGALIIVEKLISGDGVLNRLFIDHYYEYKKDQGYSNLEISQKREALENVLIPYRIDENVTLLKDAGFRHVEVFFRWYNFVAMIALK